MKSKKKINKKDSFLDLFFEEDENNDEEIPKVQESKLDCEEDRKRIEYLEKENKNLKNRMEYLLFIISLNNIDLEQYNFNKIDFNK